MIFLFTICSCFEDCYWYCIEERFCFDKNIGKCSFDESEKKRTNKLISYTIYKSRVANYNADEDEYLTKRNKGFNDFHLDAHDRPICEQPGRQENGLR